MKTKFIYLSALLVMLAACKKEESKTETTVISTPTDTVAVTETALQPMDSVAMEKAWQEYATPNDKHKMLADEAGSWTEDVTMWYAPDAKPMTTKMTAEVKMSLGGRFQTSVHKGNFMGMPFEGMNTVAYNNASGKYAQTWIDNMATGIMYMEGTYDESTKTINFSGECVDPLTKKSKKMRQTYAVVDKDTRKMESFDNTPDGKEYKSMEIIMKRKK